MKGKTINRLPRAAAAGALMAATGAGIWLFAQEGPTPIFKAKVDLVVLSFTVTDNKGKYVNGLKPADFKVLEDGIPEKLATFSEGSRPAMQILPDGSMKPLLATAPEAQQVGVATNDQRGDAFVGTNVFVLFDTSNFMYRRSEERRVGKECRSRWEWYR